MQDARAKEAAPKKPPKKSLARRMGRFCLRFCKWLAILLLVLIAGAAAGGWWLCQTESGQKQLVKLINGALAQPGNSEKLAFAITSLTGSIPSDFKFAIEARDRDGVWLMAPDNRFSFDWGALPSTIRLAAIEAVNVDIARFPHMPPEPEDKPKEPAKPLTIADVQNYLKQAADFLAKKHWWLPNLVIDQIAMSALLPADLLPGKKEAAQRLFAQFKTTVNFVDNRAELGARAEVAAADGKPVEVPSLSLQSADLALQAIINPVSDGLEASLTVDSHVEKPLLRTASLPANLLGSAVTFSLNADARARTAENNPGMEVSIHGPGLDAGHAQMSGEGQWQTDAAWKDGQIAGPLSYKLDCEFQPVSGENTALAAIRSPARLQAAASGNLPVLNLRVNLDCGEIKQDSHEITQAALALTGDNLAIPINDEALKILEQEIRLHLNLGAKVDGMAAKLDSDIFLQELPPDNEKIWRAGLRNLRLDALGANAEGNLAALILPGSMPAIDGSLGIKINDWKDLETFTPDQKLSGSVAIKADLSSALPAALANPGAPLPKDAKIPSQSSQNANLLIDIPAFAMKGKDSVIEVSQFKGDVKLADVFKSPGINARLDAAKISAAGLSMDAHISAQGAISGPLKAEVSSKGAVNSKIAAEWRPGLAKISTLEVTANIAPFLDKGAKQAKLVGVRSSAPCQIAYGDDGLHVSNLDLRLLPQGRLTAKGGLGHDKLDLGLSLRDFNFKAWQKIIPALPGGSVSLSADMGGTPARPAGKFRVDVKDVSLPQSPMPPVGLSLLGAIEHAGGGSRLAARLELDQKTVKALGGTVANVSASIPLTFAANGVPSPNMTGPLKAVARWDGALGPIWNLLPIPDRRLNGRVAVNLDASGSMRKPKINGSIAINHARYEDLLLGILLTDMNMTLSLDGAGPPGRAKGPLDSLPGSMKLDLSISDGRGGTVTAKGGGALDGGSLNIDAKIDRLRPLRRRDVHVELSGNVKVAGSALAPNVSGEIIVNKGEVLLNNLEITGSVTTLPITDLNAVKKVQAQQPDAGKSNFGGTINMRFTMLPRFTVEGRGLASLWKANMLISGALTNPQVTGNISCVRGNFDFLGKIFALTKGVVFFGGGSLADPLVDIDLTHETQDLTAHILVSGPVNKLRIRLTSDPVVPRDEIISRVLFGRSVNDLSRMEMLQLAGAVAQLAGLGGGSSPLSAAKKALGVDVLRLGTADSGAENQSSADTGGGTTLEMGKYLNDYIYMGMQQGLDADSTAFILEIELSPHSNLEMRTGEGNTWGGIKWKKNY